MEAHLPAALVARAITLPEMPGPDSPRRTELRDLLEKVVVDVPEEGEPGREHVHRQPPGDAVLDVAEAVGERERELLGGRGAGLANMVARDGDRVPARRVLSG